MTNRTKFEIWAEILEACLWQGRTQTWLLRNLRMTTQDIKIQLEFLKSRNLINIDPLKSKDYRYFKTTERGKQALDEYFSLITHFFQINKRKGF